MDYPLFKSVVLTAALVTLCGIGLPRAQDYMVLEKPIPNADKTLIKVYLAMPALSATNMTQSRNRSGF